MEIRKQKKIAPERGFAPALLLVRIAVAAEIV
jgi:hypothetical protein